MGTIDHTFLPGVQLPPALREHCERQLQQVFDTEAAEQALREAIDELQRFRAGKLGADRLNALSGRCAATPTGAARHWAIQDQLIEAVLQAHDRLVEVAA